MADNADAKSEWLQNEVCDLMLDDGDIGNCINSCMKGEINPEILERLEIGRDILKQKLSKFKGFSPEKSEEDCWETAIAWIENAIEICSQVLSELKQESKLLNQK